MSKIRRPRYFVEARVWDDIFNCYDYILLYASVDYEDALEFCESYTGPYEIVEIRKGYAQAGTPLPVVKKEGV